MSQKINELFEKNGGILQLTPTWVPRSFNEPGKRLRLHPDDYYALGMEPVSYTHLLCRFLPLCRNRLPHSSGLGRTH